MKVCKSDNFTRMLNMLRALKMSGLKLFHPRLLARKRPGKYKMKSQEKKITKLFR